MSNIVEISRIRNINISNNGFTLKLLVSLHFTMLDKPFVKPSMGSLYFRIQICF